MLVLRNAASSAVHGVGPASPLSEVHQAAGNLTSLLEWITLGAYAIIVSWAIRFHEPWVDEAQSWQLARSLPLGTLFSKYIRYEGSPGLWHLLLWILNRAHVSYSALHWLCGLVAVLSIALLLFKSPFPRYLKLCLPFTYFLVFQYAVIARSYVLVPGLLFLVAISWRKSPFIMALLLGLLANVSLHACAIAFGLAIVFGIERVRVELRGFRRWRQLLLAAIALALFAAFAAWTAWPPQDLALARFRGADRSFLIPAVASLVWGIYEPWILSIFFWTAIAAHLQKRRKLLYLLPVACFAVLSGEASVRFWHAGLLVPLVICILWIIWPANGIEAPSVQDIAVRVAMTGIVCTQVIWAAFALSFDHYHSYSPDAAAASYLQPLVERSGSVALTYLKDPAGIEAFAAVGLLPYFSRNIFLNDTHGFWVWSDHNDTEAKFPAALAAHPRIVLIETRPQQRDRIFDPHDQKIEEIERAGYHFDKAFCGERPERLELKEMNCHLIFAADPAIPAK